MSKKLLLVDDDLDFLETMSFELNEYDYKVATCSNLIEVSEFCDQNQSVDYAIVDLRVGNDSGLQIIPKLRETYPKAKIIMLTAFGSIATTVEAIKNGCDDYLMKPCSTGEILHTLEGTPPQEGEDFAVPDLYRKEREYIDYVLKMKEGNISQAAKALGIKRQSLQRKLKKFIPK